MSIVRSYDFGKTKFSQLPFNRYGCFFEDLLIPMSIQYHSYGPLVCRSDYKRLIYIDRYYTDFIILTVSLL